MQTESIAGRVDGSTWNCEVLEAGRRDEGYEEEWRGAACQAAAAWVKDLTGEANACQKAKKVGCRIINRLLFQHSLIGRLPEPGP